MSMNHETAALQLQVLTAKQLAEMIISRLACLSAVVTHTLGSNNNAAALCVQVLTTKQLAEMMVHCYPYMPSMEPFMHSLAVETGHPSKEDIVAAAQTNHMAMEWQHFNEYAKYAATGIFHGHVALVKQRSGLMQAMTEGMAAETLPMRRSQYLLL